MPPGNTSSGLPTELRRRAPSEDDGTSAKRPRASKPKVKSGCITCKTRRVKCDETKPSCRRCLKFGRACDGYSPEPSQPKGLSQLQPRIPSATSYNPSASIHTTDEQDRYFRTFSEHTAYELSGFLPSNFWSHLVLQESHNVPSIRHAVIALGALTKSLQSAPPPGLKVNVIQDVHPKHHEYAVLSHLRAISALNQYISSSSSPQVRYALIACALFVCFETFQGSYAAAVQQTYGGLKLLKSYYMGKPGSRPWIPRDSIDSSGSSIIASEVVRLLRTREGCDNVSKAIAMVQHVEEYLANEERPNIQTRSSSHEAEGSLILTKHEAFDNSQPTRNDSYPSQQISRSHSLDNLSQHHRSSLMWLPDIVPRISSAPAPSLGSTPLPKTPQSTESHTPSSSANPTQTYTSTRRRPVASQSPTPSTLQNDLPMEEILIQSFVRLDGQGLFFGMSPGIPPLIWDIHKAWHLLIPEMFSDLEAAQRCWDFLMDRALQFYRRTLFNRVYAPSTSDSSATISNQYSDHMAQLSAFDEAFQPLLSQATDSSGRVLEAGALVLSLYQKCTKILLANVQSESEMLYDDFLEDFRYITRTCTLIIACEDTIQLPRNRRFSLDTGIIPPLHLVATKCRDPFVRREAIDLLFASPRQEGMWDSVLSARIGRWIVACEEEGLPPWNEKSTGSQRSTSQDSEASYPSPPHAAEEVDTFETGRRQSVIVIRESSQKIAKHGPLPGDGRVMSPARLEDSQRPSPAKEKRSNTWIVPEENRVQLMVVNFHIPDRFIRVKCQRVLLSKDGTRVERETVIAW